MVAPVSKEAKPLDLYFDLKTMSVDDIMACFNLLDAIYRDLGGDGLVIKSAEVVSYREFIEKMKGKS